MLFVSFSLFLSISFFLWFTAADDDNDGNDDDHHHYYGMKMIISIEEMLGVCLYVLNVEREVDKGQADWKNDHYPDNAEKEKISSYIHFITTEYFCSTKPNSKSNKFYEL